MGNQQSNKMPCASNQILNSNPSYGNQYHISENMSHIYDDLLIRLNKPFATEDEIKEICEHTNMYLPGYKFVPTDDKLVAQYLMKKIANQPIPSCFIRDANVYEQHPKDLTESYSNSLVDKWYFFSTRERKYPNGTRPSRAAGNGYWKKTGIDKAIKVNDETVGFKQSLVYYVGKAPDGVKTNWIMHEFKNVEKRDRSSKSTDMKLGDYVLCRIYHNGVLNEEENKEENEKEEVKEEEVKEDEAEKEEEGSSSKIAEINQDEVNNALSYDAGNIIPAESDTKNTMHLLQEKEEEGPSSKIVEDEDILTEWDIEKIMHLLEEKEEEGPSSKIVEDGDILMELDTENTMHLLEEKEEEGPSSKSAEALQVDVHDLSFSDFSNWDQEYGYLELDTVKPMHLLEEKEKEGPSSKSAEANQVKLYDFPSSFPDFSTWDTEFDEVSQTSDEFVNAQNSYLNSSLASSN